jgi:hypothetical protein
MTATFQTVLPAHAKTHAVFLKSADAVDIPSFTATVKIVIPAKAGTHTAACTGMLARQSRNLIDAPLFADPGRHLIDAVIFTVGRRGVLHNGRRGALSISE